jgi:hypothetical protein
VLTRILIANLPKPVVDTLHELARKRGTTQTEIRCHAISVERELDTEHSQGSRVLIEKEDGEITELILRS